MIYLTIICGLELLLIVWLVFFVGAREREHAESLTVVLDAATAERHTLLSRIQRPEMVPPAPAAKAGEVVESRPPRDIGELAKIGTIANRRPDNAA